MAEAKLANYVRTVITTATVAAGDVSVDVASTADYPALGVGDYFYLVFVRLSDNLKEIVKVTAYSGTTLTIVRAQEGTTALAFAAGDRAELWLTAAGITDNLALYVLISSIVDDLVSTDVDKPLSAKQGKTLKDVQNALVTGKVNVADIVDNLTSTDTNKPLSAKQGKVLKDVQDVQVLVADVIDNLLSSETAKPLSANQGRILNQKLVACPRQVVVQGLLDGAGLATFLNGVGKTVVLSADAIDPFVVTYARGYNANGEVDNIHYITSNQTWTDGDLPNSSTCYLYVEYNDADGSLITGAITVGAPTYSLVVPAAPSVDEHWFDRNAMIMKRWTGAAWEAKARVFVGECVTTVTGSVSSVIAYQPKGYYRSAQFNVVNNTTYSQNHYIGVKPELMFVILEDDTNNEVGYLTAHSSENADESVSFVADRLNVKYITGVTYVFDVNTDIGAGPIRLTVPRIGVPNGVARILAMRGW